MSTTFTTVTVNVSGLDPEDYYNSTGDAALAVKLAEAVGGIKSGGGTDFTTGESDLDFEVDITQIFALTAALEALGLKWQVFVDDVDDDDED